MGEIAGFICFMLWVGLGGWAYGKAYLDADDHNVPAFFVCLALGPAMAGMVLAIKPTKATASTSEDANP